MTDLSAYRPELVLYVVWHPEFAAGREFATFVYDQLTRDSKEPLARGLGIPVFLRTASSPASLPQPVPFDRAVHTVTVLLVDDSMVLGRDDGWEQYVDTLVAGAKSGPHRIVPVKLSDSAFSLHGELRQRNFLPIDLKMPRSQQMQRLLIGLTHDLCRLLRGFAAVDYESEEAIESPVRVFLSHAKKDGETLIKEFKEFLQNELQLDTFFDRNGIFYADDFGKVLKQRAKESALLILQTDVYCTREWCQKEVLFAKQYHRPVLVLDHVEVGETRSFPYLGNVPTLRYRPETSMDEIIGRLLLEVLRFEYFPAQARRVGDLLGVNLEDAQVLAHSPELINLVPPSPVPKLVVYPDPPLGPHEVALLKSCDSNCRFVTPTFLTARTVTRAGPPPLIGLSLSETAPEGQFRNELEKLGFHPCHFEDAFNELARYLLASGANLAYGGDPRKGGFTERLHGLARQYSEETQDPALRVEIFLAWILHIRQNKDQLMALSQNARLRRLPLPADVAAELNLDPTQPPPATLTPADLDYLAARCFTAMREAMQHRQATANHNTICARVLLGGPLAGFAGRYPGLVEEAWFALRSHLPIYLIGAFGGCTQAVIDAVEGRRPASLTLEGQLTLDAAFRQQLPPPAAGQPTRRPYGEKIADFYARAAKHGVEPIDYEELLKTFESAGADDLKQLSHDNGLSPAENRRLFETPHVSEMIQLILKGIEAVQSRK